MGKVHFKYGVMGSAKSMDLIRTEYNYRERGMETLVFISHVDTRAGGKVWTRIGNTLEGRVIQEDDDLLAIVRQQQNDSKHPLRGVFVDDAHFLPARQIDQLGAVADHLDIRVLCYGLRCDFRGILFEGSKRLFELADEIEEIKALCACGKNATLNARFVDGRPVKTGEQISVGSEHYNSYCRKCYNQLFATD